MTLTNKKILAYFISLSSIFIGIAIYSFFRKPPLLLNRLYEWLNLQNSIQAVRNNNSNLNLPEWFLYGLPDLLWMFSFTLMILIIWNFKLDAHSLIWIIAVLCIGLAYELLQIIKITPGIFDFKDLGYILTGALLALLFTIKFKKYAKMD